MQINIQVIRIAEVDTGSAVAVGNNYFVNWKTYHKMNSGFGRLNGDGNSMADALFRVEDPDWQDMICGDEKSDFASWKLPG